MNDIKFCFAMITFNSDFVLKQCLDSIYNFAEQIVINHGCVNYWQEKGYKTSSDDTAKILSEYPDPQNKITVINVNAEEKTGLCSAYMPYINNNITHLFTIDSDEIYKPEDLEKIIHVLKERNPHSISFRSNTFFGGFTHILGGFERAVGFKRLLKYEPGCRYVEHRPPSLSVEKVPNPIHIGSDEMADRYGVEFYHYSYVFARQVYEKVQYYKEAVSKHNCMDNYFNSVWLPWVLGNEEQKRFIEDANAGVHEFKKSYRGECRTQIFTGQHPKVIQDSMPELIEKFNKQLESFK
jgi:glycosyltransferase involved in cell wall biosynthesis